MREKVILICEECLSRNYTYTRDKLANPKRMVLRKYCKVCNKLHRSQRDKIGGFYNGS